MKEMCCPGCFWSSKGRLTGPRAGRGCTVGCSLSCPCELWGSVNYREVPCAEGDSRGVPLVWTSSSEFGCAVTEGARRPQQGGACLLAELWYVVRSRRYAGVVCLTRNP